ncbi:DUF4184 domain-containing protein [Nocardiopsis gilva YIM 90087]|uniref:DUF4184 domain-containing protein n=1 Tax=Nocardiopsis gilva YIM 90087 TaxID=1235441 RepID=A0A223S8A4_9ACTN|nr:DUF4184 family protein [Nocardiopsis gilva]ASU84319.1 DUF4184 domain-containing protein [Nocardiopsis gilva YIM 90087]
MPFTICHAAVAIPMSRDRLVPSALAIGAMSPDFVKFVPVTLPEIGSLGHQMSELVLGSLMGMGVFVVFQALLKRPLVALAPGWARRRLAGPSQGFRWSARTLGWAALSVFLGAITHIVLDGVTHGDILPFLTTDTVVGSVSRQQVVQDGLSIVLGVAIIAWCVRWMVRAIPAEEEPQVGPLRWWRVPVWTGMALLVGLAALNFALVPAEAFRINRWQTEADLVWTKLAMLAVDTVMALTFSVFVYALIHTALQLIATLRQGRGGSRADGRERTTLPGPHPLRATTGPQPQTTGPQQHLGMRE